LELYLMEDLAFSITVAAGFLALAQISGAAGRIFWGVVSDRFFAARRRPVLLLVGSIATVMNLLTGFLPQAGSVWLVFVVVSLLGFTLQGWNGLSHTLAFELVGTRVAGLAIGIANTTGFLGVICLPPLYGFLVDYSESYRLAWLALAGMILPALAALLWGTENKKV
jgi:sugar phosphate permease